MNFRIVWLDQAIAQLTIIYLASLGIDGGDAVVRAAAHIDMVLPPNPSSVGESRSGHERVMFEPPLTVYFEVHLEEHVVVITSVRRPT